MSNFSRGGPPPENDARQAIIDFSVRFQREATAKLKDYPSVSRFLVSGSSNPTSPTTEEPESHELRKTSMSKPGPASSSFFPSASASGSGSASASGSGSAPASAATTAATTDAASGPAAEMVWYEGGCHCGAVQYKVHLPSLTAPTLEPVVQCTCSICHKNGYLLVYPERKDIVWHQGFDDMKVYLWGPKLRPQKFCGECGSSILIDLADTRPSGQVVAMNARMFKGVDLAKLNFEHLDGRNLVHPEFNEKF